MKNKVLDEVKHAFRPEFLNRVDEMVVFHQLSREQIAEIVGLELAKVIREVKAQEMELEVTEDAKQLLAKKGWDPQFGARPLRRAIQREVEDELAEEMLKGNFGSGDRILAEVSQDNPEKLSFSKIPSVDPPPGRPKPAGGPGSLARRGTLAEVRHEARRETDGFVTNNGRLTPYALWRSRLPAQIGTWFARDLTRVALALVDGGRVVLRSVEPARVEATVKDRVAGRDGGRVGVRDRAAGAARRVHLRRQRRVRARRRDARGRAHRRGLRAAAAGGGRGRARSLVAARRRAGRGARPRPRGLAGARRSAPAVRSAGRSTSTRRGCAA